MSRANLPIFTPKLSINGVHCAARHRNPDGSYSIPFEVEGEACEGHLFGDRLTVKRLRDGAAVGYEGKNRVQRYKVAGTFSEVTIYRLVEPQATEPAEEVKATEYVPTPLARPNFELLHGGLPGNRAARRRRRD